MSDDPKISERYRELPREEPPRALDDAILAASRRAVQARPAPLVAPDRAAPLVLPGRRRGGDHARGRGRRCTIAARSNPQRQEVLNAPLPPAMKVQEAPAPKAAEPARARRARDTAAVRRAHSVAPRPRPPRAGTASPRRRQQSRAERRDGGERRRARIARRAPPDAVADGACLGRAEPRSGARAHRAAARRGTPRGSGQGARGVPQALSRLPHSRRRCRAKVEKSSRQ